MGATSGIGKIAAETLAKIRARSVFSGLASPVEIVARGPGTLAKWDLRFEVIPERRAAGRNLSDRAQIADHP
jgi:hypothetical protein